MSRKILSNGENGLSFRSKLNSMFEELYGTIHTNFAMLNLKFISILNDTNPNPKGQPENGDYHLIGLEGYYEGFSCKENDVLIWSEDDYEWQRMPFGKREVSEVLQYADGTVDPTGEVDPSNISLITHDFQETYAYAPKVVIIPKVDWDLHVFAVTTSQVYIKPGANGSSQVLDYDLLVLQV